MVSYRTHRCYLYCSISLVLFIDIFSASIFAEGTKQIYPPGGGDYMFCISHDPTRNQFAQYGCPVTERLNIEILNPGEIIYYGFNAGSNTSGLLYRIKDPMDNIVVPQAQIPTFGPGFITDLNEARTGPNTIYPGGYEPLSYVALQAGTYYLEFSFTPYETNITFMDITVANPGDTTEIPGRLWSKGWQFSSTGSEPQYDATMYVYTDDQICTSINFNGMRPYTFDISCNQTGCAQTGNFVQDRKSRPGRHLYPQFKIFLNPPDSIAFPTGILGQIDSTAVASDCDGSVAFTIWVSKNGSAEVLLDIYPPAGYNDGDVTLPSGVLPGSTGNTILWNGLDGFGQPVPNGTQVNAIVSYLNGLTHLPIYDVEWNFSYDPHWTGYLVQMVRPPGVKPALYWNDSLCGGDANLTGCTDNKGCHTWGYNQGDNSTINTWWYAVSTSTTPITILSKHDMNYDSVVVFCQGDSILVGGVYQKTSGTYQVYDTSRLTGCDSSLLVQLTVNPSPVADLGPDVWVCDGGSHQFNAGAGTGYTYRWDNLTTGLMNIANTQTFTTGVQGFYKVSITNTYGCTNSDSVHLFVSTKPNMTNNPMSDTLCSNTTFTLNLTSAVPGATFEWIPSILSGNITGATAGSGTTISNILINTQPSNSILQYTITPISGECYGNDTIYTVVVKPKPMVTNTTLGYSLCSPGTITIPLTSQVPSPTFGWTATASSGNVTGFSSGIGTIIQQVLINTGANPETVTYKTAATADGCTGDTVVFTVALSPTPDLTNSPLNQVQCNNVNTSILLTSTFSGTLFTWIAVPGSGSITGWSNQMTPSSQISQILVNSSTMDQTVTYHITPHLDGCDGEVSNYMVTVHPSPDLSNSPLSKSQCNNTNTSIQLTSLLPGTLFTWTASGSSLNVTGFSNNNIPASQINQILVNSGFGIETVTYNITPFANNCSGSVYPYTVTVYPTPDLQVTPPLQSLCSGETTNIVLHSIVSGASFSWTASGSSPDVSGYSGGLGNLIQQALFNSGYLMPAVTYLVTSSANGCIGMQSAGVVTVKPKPTIVFPVCFDTITISSAAPIQLKGGIPPGGTYSGPGVNTLTGIFTPSLAGAGTKTITYSYTNIALCSASKTRNILVQSPTAFICGDDLIDIRDNKVYPTVLVGSQCWMAADLNYGNDIPSSQHQRDNCIPEKYLNPFSILNPPSSVYQWDELMLYSDIPCQQGICPPGWHVPSETEWNTLFAVYIGNGFAGSPLKYSGFSGFNAILSGARHQNVQWDYPGFATFFWTSTPHGPNKAWAHGLNDPDPSVSLYPSLRSNAFSLRCTRD